MQGMENEKNLGKVIEPQNVNTTDTDQQITVEQIDWVDPQTGQRLIQTTQTGGNQPKIQEHAILIEQDARGYETDQITPDVIVSTYENLDKYRRIGTSELFKLFMTNHVSFTGSDKDYRRVKQIHDLLEIHLRGDHLQCDWNLFEFILSRSQFHKRNQEVLHEIVSSSNFILDLIFTNGLETPSKAAQILAGFKTAWIRLRVHLWLNVDHN